MAKYGNYSKSRASSGPPNTFTAKITIPNKPARHIPNCKVWNGVVVQLVSVGQRKKVEKGAINSFGEGETWEEWEYYAYIPKPLICLAKLSSEAEKEASVTLMKACEKSKDYTPVFEQYKHAMFIMGDNGHGYVVEDQKEVEERAVRENRNISLYEGFRGFKMIERLPAEVWSKIKSYATFYKREEIEEWYEDMDDFHRVDDARYEAGWNYSGEIIPILVNLGYQLTYRDEPITSYDDVAKIDSLLRERQQEAARVAQERSERGKFLEKRFSELVNWELMDKRDTGPVDDIPKKILSKLLRREGSHIYGVGWWFKRDDNYLYEISQNGHDGDDWSRNNSRSGIIWRTPLTDELRAILAEIQVFDKQ